MKDEKIVELFLKRNEKAIEETNLKYGSLIKSLSFKILKDLESAEECENDTYFEAWNLIPPHKPSNYFPAFLSCIARSISLNLLRSRKALKRQGLIISLDNEMEECIPSPDDVNCRMDEKEFKILLNNFLSSLSYKKRYIFLRRYWFLDSIKEIASLTGLKEGNIKTQLSRIRKELKEFLKKEGYTI